MEKCTGTRLNIGGSTDKNMDAAHLVLDADTLLEQVIVGVGIVVAGFSFLYVTEILKSDDWQHVMAAVGLPLVMTYLLRRVILQDYVVVPKERHILFRTRAFGRMWVRPVASFDQILMVAVQPRRESSRSGVSWDYGLAVVLKSGKVLTVIWPGDKNFDEVCKLGRDTANLLEVLFERGEQQHLMRVLKVDGAVKVDYRPSASEQNISSGLFLAAILLVVGVALCFMFFTPS